MRGVIGLCKYWKVQVWETDEACSIEPWKVEATGRRFGSMKRKAFTITVVLIWKRISRFGVSYPSLEVLKQGL